MGSCPTAGFDTLTMASLSGQALSKKENKGGGAGSPDGGDSDGELETLTPRTEAKYNKIDEEFQIMMQHRNHVNGGSRNLQVNLKRIS